MNISDEGRDATGEYLALALSEEAAMVSPSPAALQAIQQRTAAKSPARARWIFGGLGAGLATAAVITAVVLVADDGPDAANTPAVDQPTDGAVGPVDTHEGFYDPAAGDKEQLTMVYVGPQPRNTRLAPRLYLEPHTVPDNDWTNLAVAHEFLTSTPIDPDYTSGWPEGIDVVDIDRPLCIDRCTIQLVGDADLTDPGDLSPGQAELALQALLHTAGYEPKTSVEFTYNGAPVTTLLGVDVSQRVKVRSDDEVRALISIDNIVDGQTVPSPVTVEVAGNTFEGTVNWSLADVDSGTEVDSGFVTTSMGLWTQVDVQPGDLDPGDYLFKAFEYSAEDGRIINLDSKTFTVE